MLCWERSEIDPDRQTVVLQSFVDFRNRYMNKATQVGVDKEGNAKYRPLGHWWLEHGQRRQFLALRFLPGQPEQVGRYLNMWRGFAVEPAPGDWSRMRAHIDDVLAAGDPDAADYIVRWSAWSVQNPDRPAEVALVFRGGKGVGKGVFGRALKSLFGQHGMQVMSPAQVTGRFNSHLRDCCLLFADEALLPGDKAAENVLKFLITEPELPIEGKGLDITQCRNHTHLVMASNDEWVVPSSHDERRYAVFDVSPDRAGDHDYFGAVVRQMDEGGRAAMLHDLQKMDLGDWHPRRNVPQTAALSRQKELSLPPEDQFLLAVLDQGALPSLKPRNTSAPKGTVVSGRLYEAMRESSPGLRNASDQRLAAFLKKWGCVGWRDNSERGWTWPPLGEMRAAWTERFGPREWQHDVADWDEPEGHAATRGPF